MISGHTGHTRGGVFLEQNDDETMRISKCFKIIGGWFCPSQATRVHGTSLVPLNESLAQIIVTLALGNKMKVDQRQSSQNEWSSPRKPRISSRSLLRSAFVVLNVSWVLHIRASPAMPQDGAKTGHWYWDQTRHVSRYCGSHCPINIYCLFFHSLEHWVSCELGQTPFPCLEKLWQDPLSVTTHPRS